METVRNVCENISVNQGCTLLRGSIVAACWLMQQMANPEGLKDSSYSFCTFFVHSSQSVKDSFRTSALDILVNCCKGQGRVDLLRTSSLHEGILSCWVIVLCRIPQPGWRSQPGLTAVSYQSCELAQCESTAQPSAPQPISRSKHSDRTATQCSRVMRLDIKWGYSRSSTHPELCKT